MSNALTNIAPCPKCSKADASAVGFTWWGGVLGPKLLHVVSCNGCKTQYNGKTGKMNTTNIIIYSVIVGIIAIVVVAALSQM